MITGAEELDLERGTLRILRKKLLTYIDELTLQHVR